MATMNTADIGFEREIWKAADKMRGNIDASEYKSVVLGLIFLKYISDKFKQGIESVHGPDSTRVFSPLPLVKGAADTYHAAAIV
jgi:type I restriction-modification system DNA methylase subunit